jgi:hypothetical protein
VLSPSYPTGLLSNKLYIAAGVLAAFECKRTLRREHIRRPVRTSAELSALVRSDEHVSHKIVFGLLAHSYHLPSKRNRPEETLAQALVKADEEEVADPRDCLGFVCVPNLGTWSFMSSIMNIEGKGPALTTSYMGPLQEVLSDGYPNPDAIGRFLTGLWRRLGKPTIRLPS